ncbi:MAG: hypothetical protein GY737_21235 [Desulfobacteraceae bacterium]|nr:hypothetical protein [Desulfobacteraceae bacterium]
MGLKNKKLLNRSSRDRRKADHPEKFTVERRVATEKRKDWQRVAGWTSSHKPVNTVDLSKISILAP